MKKIFLSTFVLLLVGSTAVAQEKAGKGSAASKNKKTTLETKAVASKSQAPTSKAAQARTAAAASAASLVEFNKAAKSN